VQQVAGVHGMCVYPPQHIMHFRSTCMSQLPTRCELLTCLAAVLCSLASSHALLPQVGAVCLVVTC
jgi:hypothetical protein